MPPAPVNPPKTSNRKAKKEESSDEEDFGELEAFEEEMNSVKGQLHTAQKVQHRFHQIFS